MGEKDIQDIFYTWTKGWVEWDAETQYVTLSDNHFTGIGTAANEENFDKKSMIDDFNKVMRSRKELGLKPRKLEKIEYKIRSVYVKNGFGDLYAENEGPNDFIYRRTFVFEKQDGKWKIIHFHISAPDPLVNAGEEFRSQENMRRELDNWIKNFDFNPSISDEVKKSKAKKYLTEAVQLLHEQTEFNL